MCNYLKDIKILDWYTHDDVSTNINSEHRAWIEVDEKFPSDAVKALGGKHDKAKEGKEANDYSGIGSYFARLTWAEFEATYVTIDHFEDRRGWEFFAFPTCWGFESYDKEETQPHHFHRRGNNEPYPMPCSKINVLFTEMPKLQSGPTMHGMTAIYNYNIPDLAQERMKRFLKMMLENWWNLNLRYMKRQRARQPYRRDPTVTMDDEICWIQPFKASKNLDARDARLVIDVCSPDKADHRHKVIARIIRSLRIFKLKKEAKAVYRHFYYTGKNIDDKTRDLWRQAMYRNRWHRYAERDNDKESNNSDNSESDPDDDAKSNAQSKSDPHTTQGVSRQSYNMTGSGGKKSGLQDRRNAAGGWGANPKEILDEEERVTNYIGPGHDGKGGHVRDETGKNDGDESSDLSSLPSGFDDDNDPKPSPEPHGGSGGNGGNGSIGGGSGGRGNKRKGDEPGDDHNDPSTYGPGDPKRKNPAKATRPKKKTKTRSTTKTDKAKATVSSAAGADVSQTLSVLKDTHRLSDEDKGELYRLYRQAALRDGLTWEEIRQEIATSKNWLPPVDYVPPPQKSKEVIAQPGMLTRAMNTITNLMGSGSSGPAQEGPSQDGAAPTPDRMSNGVPIVPLADNMFSHFMDMMDPGSHEQAAAEKEKKEEADVEEAGMAETQRVRKEKKDTAIEKARMRAKRDRDSRS